MCTVMSRRTAQQSHTGRRVHWRRRQLARLCRLVSSAVYSCWLWRERPVVLASSWSGVVQSTQGLPTGRQPLPHTNMSNTSPFTLAAWFVHLSLSGPALGFTKTRSLAVARISDRTSPQHLWGQVKSSVTGPFDSPCTISYWWSFGTKPLSLTVSEIFNVECNAMVDMTLIRPLNKGQGQGHSLWYQSISHIRLPIGCQ